jgi:hypothetical protein
LVAKMYFATTAVAISKTDTVVVVVVASDDICK